MTADPSDRLLRRVLDSMTPGVIVRDHDLDVLFANEAAHRMLGKSARAGAEQLDTWTFVDETGDEVGVVLRDVVDRGISWTGRLYRAEIPGETEPRWFHSDAAPLDLPDGTRGTISVFAEVTGLEGARRQAEEDRQTLQLIFDNANELMWRSDTEGRAVWVSPSVTTVLGWPPEELLGTEVLDFVHPDDRTTAAAARAAAERGELTSLQVRALTRDGRWVPLAIRGGGFRDADANLAGAFATAHDNTAEVAAQKAKADSEQRFRRLVALGDLLSASETGTEAAAAACAFLARYPGDACFALEVEGDTVHVAAAAHRDPARAGAVGRLVGTTMPTGDGMFGSVLATGMPTAIEEHVVDADRSQTARAFAAFVDEAGLSGILLVPVTDGGEVVGALGLCRDGTSEPYGSDDLEFMMDAARRVGRVVRLRKLTEAVAESEEQFRLAMQNAPIGMALVGLDYRLVAVNQALCDLVGYSESELTALTFPDITHPDDLDADERNVKDLLAGRVPDYRMEKRYICADGSIVWALLAVSLVRTAGGEPLHFVSQIMDITESHAQRELLEHHVTHDALTGLLNRFGLDEELGGALAPDDAVLYCDLDGFKELNDAFGHASGDLALRVVAERLTTRLRESDSVARVGGDEFVVVLRHQREPEGHTLVADELRAAVARPITLEHGDAWRLTLSVGVCPPGERDPEKAVHIADQALLKAKRLGRDTVVTADADVDDPGRPSPTADREADV